MSRPLRSSPPNNHNRDRRCEVPRRTGHPRRGFKRLAEDIAEELRAELDLERHDPADPFRLAEHLLIPTAPFASLREHGMSSKSIATLAAPYSPVSAFTVFWGPRKAIYYNPGHSSRRTANSIAHELAHVILEHEPLSSAASRTWNDLQEVEADWLGGGVLLVPRCAALRWLELGGGITDGADHYRVSVDLFRWRVNHTGVARQLERRESRAR